MWPFSRTGKLRLPVYVCDERKVTRTDFGIRVYAEEDVDVAEILDKLLVHMNLAVKVEYVPMTQRSTKMSRKIVLYEPEPSNVE